MSDPVHPEPGPVISPTALSDSELLESRQTVGDVRDDPDRARVDWEQLGREGEGPPQMEEDDPIPENLEKKLGWTADAPLPVDAALQAKKAKEAKKAAEKEAKLRKLQEKQNAKKAAEAAPAKPKAKESTKKAKTPLEDLLAHLNIVGKGEKKPIDLLPDGYEPRFVESNWYEWWVNEGFFKPEYGLREGQSMAEAIEERGKFVIVIPPPNVTGTLHLGHALMCTVEDVLTRWNRMRGKVTLWVPGCDHAGIATQMVVEKTIARTEGKSRHDLGREEFIRRVWEWKNAKGNRIYEQLKRMGISADWDRVSFTMDEKLSAAVRKAFVTLFDWGLIYRADRLVNWSCTLKSCISDIEVDKVELTGRTMMSVPGYKNKVEFGVLSLFAYKFNETEEIVVATTRPETMLGDVAIAVHPEDERYRPFVGRKAKHPFVDRELIIITDEYVDKEFGTGAVKITPAHDQNDYDIGKRHNLEFITVIDEDGKMKDNCGKFSGMPRFEARTAVLAALTDLGLFRSSQENAMVVPVCSRSKDIVEPLLKLQWYVDCKEMAEQAKTVVENKALGLIPEHHTKIWNHWMNGIRDWCISRQLWWGHQIPAYKIVTQSPQETVEELWVAAESEEEAKAKATKKLSTGAKFELVRDEDVLDTWFSSSLFPFSVFGWPDAESEDLKVFYPTDLLETGHDILFFWVAKMVFMATTLTQSVPFAEVFLHSIIRDAHGRKMSKSLGNIIDPLDVIHGITLADLNRGLEEGNLDKKELDKAKEGQRQSYPNGIPECGTDALRFALCAHMTAGARDINLDVMRIQGYRFFCNKLWNAVKFAMLYLKMGDYNAAVQESPATAKPEVYSDRLDNWILSKLETAVRECDGSLEKYSFQEATTAVYNFWLYELCDVYLESLKPKYIDVKPETVLSPELRRHLDVLLFSISTALTLLSPFMPYLSEELWQRLPTFKNQSRPPSICVEKYPKPAEFKKFENEKVEKEVTVLNHFVHSVRAAKAALKIPNKTRVEAFVLNTEEGEDEAGRLVVQEEQVTMCALAFTKSIQLVKSREEAPAGVSANVVSEKCTVYINIPQT